MSKFTLSAADPLPKMLPEGRRFSGQRKVRLGDVNQHGRLRLDALTRYTQDVSDDDTTDAELPETPGWVVRSTVVDQVAHALLGEQLFFTTFCSGLGKRWAERRLSITGEGGAHYEVATLWVCVDPTSGQPHALTERFLELYGEAAGGRKVSARLANPKLGHHGQMQAGSEPELQVESELQVEPWQLRAVDYDVYGHVNNAAYWALVEQWVDESVLAGSFRARLEYGAGISPAETVTIARTAAQSGARLWWVDGGEATGAFDARTAATLASAAVDPLVSGLY